MATATRLGAARSAAPSLAPASAAIVQADKLLLLRLERGRRVGAKVLRRGTESAYDTREAATVLSLRKYGKTLLRISGSPASAAGVMLTLVHIIAVSDFCK